MHDDMIETLRDCANALGELLPHDHAYRKIVEQANRLLDRHDEASNKQRTTDTMAEWDLTPQQEQRLDGIARDEALLSQERHAYLPTTPEEAATFTPHEWVLEAMRRASW